MKLTGSLKISLVCVLFLLACQYKSKEDFLVGYWKFVAITGNVNKFETSERDFLSFTKDSSFQYEITALKRRREGKWQIKDKQLILKYSNPDTTRVFNLEILSKNNLKFNENNVVFEFIKE